MFTKKGEEKDKLNGKLDKMIRAYGEATKKCNHRCFNCKPHIKCA